MSTPAMPAAPDTGAPVQPRNGLGIAGLVLGIVGCVLGIIPILGIPAIICGIIGAVLGLVGFARARKGGATNLKMALIGAILSVAAIGLGIWGTVTVDRAVNQVNKDLNDVSTSLNNELSNLNNLSTPFCLSSLPKYNTRRLRWPRGCPLCVSS